MCLYINKVINDLETLKNLTENSFKDSKTEIESSAIGDEKKKARDFVLLDQFTRKGQEIYTNLNFSVLNGSYVQKKEFEDKIIQCRDLIDKIRTLIPESENIGDQIDSVFGNLLLDSLKQYRYLVHSFHVSLKTPNKLLFIADSDDEENHSLRSPKALETLHQYYDIFRLNILIAIFDRNFALNGNTLKALLDVLHKLRKHKCNDEAYCKILIDKCTLLIIKFKLKYDNEEQFQSLLVSHDFTDEEFNPQTLTTEFLKGFQNIVLHVYSPDSEDNSNFYKEYYQQYKAKSEFSYTDYFLFIRYYSKVEKNLEGINDLITKFKQQFEKCSGSEFDKFSYNISINYLYNNKISFLTRQQDIDCTTIDEEFNKIQQIQTRTGIKNYFPFYKIASYYDQFIEKNIEDVQYKGEIDLALTKLSEATKLIESNLEWTDRFDILPFQPDYKSCCVEQSLGDTKLNIFIASAYITPTNYTFFKKELEKLQENLQLYRSMVKMNTFLSKEHKFVEEAHQEAKESQKNNIQILSVFAALVIFAVGNMQVFKTVETLKEAIIFMLTLAYSLCLFAVVIWFIVSYKKVKMTLAHKILIVTLFLGLAFSCFVIFSKWGNTPINSSENKNEKPIHINTTQDSTQTIPPDHNQV